MTDDDMSFFFPELEPAGNGIVPLPPEEMRFTELRAEPVLDEGPLRTRVYVEVTAFQQRPYIDVTLNGADGEEIASASVIEPMSRKNVFTIHIRGPQQSGKFQLCARLYYPEKPDSDTREFSFEI
jgi:hypothetical protein